MIFFYEVTVLVKYVQIYFRCIITWATFFFRDENTRNGFVTLFHQNLGEVFHCLSHDFSESKGELRNLFFDWRNRSHFDLNAEMSIFRNREADENELRESEIYVNNVLDYFVACLSANNRLICLSLDGQRDTVIELIESGNTIEMLEFVMRYLVRQSTELKLSLSESFGEFTWEKILSLLSVILGPILIGQDGKHILDESGILLSVISFVCC